MADWKPIPMPTEAPPNDRFPLTVAGMMGEGPRKIALISLSAKCSDMCSISLHDDAGTELKDHHGYVPHGFGIGGGDCIELEIDFETGQILNWKKPEADDVEEFLNPSKRNW